jgi:hypothetical protein
MERSGINIPLHCLDILKRRGTKLIVSGGIILNSFHPISFCSAPFHYYFLNPNNGTLLYFIPFRSIQLYFINPNGASVNFIETSRRARLCGRYSLSIFFVVHI